MTVFSHTTGFTRGEVEASLFDRYDVDFYAAASKRIDNWFPDVTGSIERRPAFTPLANDGVPFFIPARPTGFPSNVDTDDFYIRTFLFRGDEYLIVFRKVTEDGWQTVTASCYQIDNATPVVQFEDEYLVYYSDVSTDLATLLTGNLPPDSQGGEVPKEFSFPLAQNICIAQVGPAVFVTSPLFPPYRIFIDGTGAANIERVTWFEELLGEIEVKNNDDEWDGEDTLLNEQLSVNDSFFFRGVEYTVKSVSSATKIRSNETYTGISVAGERIQIISSVFNTDWPRLCVFHKGRLFLFSTRSSPVGMWASKSGDPFTIIAGSTYDDAPINVELLTQGAEDFVWVDSGDRIILGGEQAEYLLDSLPDQPITPTSFSFYRVASNGGAPLAPFSSDASSIFVNRGRTRVQAVRFDDASRGYVGQDLSLLAPHLLIQRIKDIVYRPGTQNDRASRIFVQLDTNDMRTCTLSENENVIAWSRITLPDGFIARAIATSPDDMYAIVQCPDEETFVLSKLDVGSDTFYLMDLVDEVAAVDGVATVTTMHKDTTVAVLDGSRFVGFFETDGTTLDIDEEFTGALTIGLAYASLIDMLPVVLPETQRGATLNRKHRLVRVLVSVEEAYQMSVNGEPLFGTLAVNDVTGFSKRSGTFERRFLGWQERPRTEIEVTSIYRAKLRSVTREVNI